MFKKTADLYDLAEAHRNYSGQAMHIEAIIGTHNPTARTLLEVACGTGTLLSYLGGFVRTGADISPQMLRVARRKLPASVSLIESDLAHLELGRQYDIVLCLDGAIGYLKPEQIPTALEGIALHTIAKGLVLLEPWYEPATWEPSIYTFQHKDELQHITAVRMAHGLPDGRINFEWLVGTSDGIRRISESYKFYLHELEVLTRGLEKFFQHVWYEEPTRHFSRGLIVATTPTHG
jgi:SAM-dependent methyltransferase